LEEKAFPAIKCKRKLPWNSCDSFQNAYMGYHASSSIPEGDYYLKTKDFPPFSMGMNGIDLKNAKK
jgi:hypothetical protein